MRMSAVISYIVELTFVSVFFNYIYLNSVDKKI